MIHEEEVVIYYGKFEAKGRPGERGADVYDFVKNLQDFQEFPLCWAVVEGAAYNRFHGQVALEEVRFAFYLALRHLHFDAVIIPPATIRKGVLGSGRLSMVDTYPAMNQNAADSIGCALYALDYKGEK